MNIVSSIFGILFVSSIIGVVPAMSNIEEGRGVMRYAQKNTKSLMALLEAIRVILGIMLIFIMIAVVWKGVASFRLSDGIVNIIPSVAMITAPVYGFAIIADYMSCDDFNIKSSLKSNAALALAVTAITAVAFLVVNLTTGM